MQHSDPTTYDARPDLDSLQPPLRLDRRGFVKTSLGAGFAAAVLPVQAQTMITTDTQGLTAGEVRIPVAGGEMVAYRAQPAGKTGLPVVLVVSGDIRRARAHQGRRRAGSPSRATWPSRRNCSRGRVTRPRCADIQALIRDIVAKMPDAQVMADLDAAAAWAAKNGGGGKLGITGFCWGGRIVWMYAAHNPNLAAGVAWYGPVARGYYPGDKGAIDGGGVDQGAGAGSVRRC